MQHATGTFHVSGMKEEPYQELAGDGEAHPGVRRPGLPG